MAKSKRKRLNGTPKEDGMGVGMAVLSWLFPPVGAYQYLAHKDDKPKRARIGGGLALLGLATGVVMRMQFKNQLKEQEKLNQ
jgi:hypothetical protein